MTAQQAPTMTIDRALLRDAAKRICNGPPSARFLELLEEQIAFLPKLGEGIKHWPLRVDTRKRLNEARRYAGLLSRELQDIHFATTATLGKSDFNYISLASQLGELEKMVALAYKSIPSGKGGDRSPALFDEQKTQPRQPKLVCAAIVTCAWQAARGTLIPYSEEIPQQATAELWRAAGHLEDGSIGKWKYWLKKAKENDLSDVTQGSLVPWFVEQWKTASLGLLGPTKD